MGLRVCFIFSCCRCGNMSKRNICTIDTTLFRRFGLHQIVNPNGPKKFGFNKYILIHIALFIFMMILTIIGISGYIYDFGESTNKFHITIIDMQFFCAIDCIFLASSKILTIFFYRNKMFNLFNIMHESFFLSKQCKKNYDHVKFKKHYKKTFYLNLCFLIGSIFLWIISPIILILINSFSTKPQTYIRKPNIVNFNYPVSNYTYNLYYTIFYILEGIITIYSVYCIVLFDVFMYAILQLIANYYTVVSYTFEHFDFKIKNKNSEFITLLNADKSN